MKQGFFIPLSEPFNENVLRNPLAISYKVFSAIGCKSETLPSSGANNFLHPYSKGTYFIKITIGMY